MSVRSRATPSSIASEDDPPGSSSAASASPFSTRTMPSTWKRVALRVAAQTIPKATSASTARSASRDSSPIRARARGARARAPPPGRRGQTAPRRPAPVAPRGFGRRGTGRAPRAVAPGARAPAARRRRWRLRRARRPQQERLAGYQGDGDERRRTITTASPTLTSTHRTVPLTPSPRARRRCRAARRPRPPTAGGGRAGHASSRVRLGERQGCTEHDEGDGQQPELPPDALSVGGRSARRGRARANAAAAHCR